MKLAEPITNAGGTTLMPAGVRLTPMFLARLKKWNIDEVDVFVETLHGDAAGDSPVGADGAPRSRHTTSIRRQRSGEGATAGAQEQFARSVAAEVARVFTNARENPLMMHLRSIVIKRIVAQGPDSSITALRRGPLDEAPLPVAEEDA